LIRLLAIDLDGTLLDSRWQVSEVNRRAIAGAIDRGVHVVLVTGRRFDFTRSIIDCLPTGIDLIVSNGALIKSSDGTTLVRRLLPRSVARRILGATLEFRANAAVVFDRPGAGQVVLERIDWNDPARGGYFERNRPYLAEIRPLECSLTEDPIQVLYTGSVLTMRRLTRTLRALDFAADISIAVAEYQDRDFTIVDVVHRSCSKASALDALARRLGFQREEILAIGDNFNDRGMLEYAGVPVVMGNAVPELKSLGWPVTLSNDDSGVAAAIEQFVLADHNR
jgi:5-amino-6-(5-phospho-D-ribitylamino)uracil phosphatase